MTWTSQSKGIINHTLLGAGSCSWEALMREGDVTIVSRALMKACVLQVLLESREGCKIASIEP